MHVRICVECGEEYRPEIAICADCGGRLEDRHDDEGRTVLSETSPAESSLDPDEEFTERILHEDGATQLVKAADRLVEQGIACRIWPAQAPRQRPFAFADDEGRGDAALAPGPGYGLWVTARDRDRALAALGPSPAAADAVNADSAGADGSRSCPACGGTVSSGVVDCPQCGLAVGDEPD